MGKSSGPQTTVQKTELPEWVQTEAQKNLRIADEIASRPYQAYGGSTVAGFAPEQEQAFQLAQSNIGAYRPALTAATGAAAQGAFYQPQQVTAPSFLTGNIQGYMNPYLAEVEQRAGDALQRQLAQTQNQIASQAVQARAFGGSRQGIQEGVAAAEASRAMGDLSAQLRSQGFQQAAALQQADQARAMQAALANQQAGLAGAGLGLQGAGVLGNLAQQAQQAGITDVGALGAVGAQRQALEQQQLQDAYARFVEQRDYPTQALNLRLAALGATPYGQTTTQTAPSPQGSNALAGLGGIGSFMAGAAQLLPMFLSDKSEKTDIKKIGKDEDTGLNLYSYRYKGDPKTYPKTVGPMAQEIEKKFPEMVKEVAGRKAVDGNFLMGMMRK
jgi:hypothetical protein